MPPRIRSRACKASKENIDVAENKLKPVKSTTKLPRRALADKTNSASDDTSVEIPKPKKTIVKSSKTAPKQNVEDKQNKKNKQNTQAKPQKSNNVGQKENSEPINDARPRRERRIPTRFVENPLLNDLSKSKESVNTSQNSSVHEIITNNTPVTKKNKEISPNNNDDKLEPSPFKTPSKPDSSLLACRPRRICRLPSRFDDHSTSPNKYIPIQPANASTPIQQSKNKPFETIKGKANIISKKSPAKVDNTIDSYLVPKVKLTRLPVTDLESLKSNDNSSNKSSPDSNNNAKRSTRAKRNVQGKTNVNAKEAPAKKVVSPAKRVVRSVKKVVSPANKVLSPVKKAILSSKKAVSPTKKIFTFTRKSEPSIIEVDSPVKTASPKKTSNKNLSFKLLGSKKTSQKNDNKDLDDIYEFTFDPNEEPQPQKKKRKKTVTKKPSQPKKATYKSSYDRNISRALSALKNAVKPSKTVEAPKLPQIAETETVEEVPENVQQNLTANKAQMSINNQNNVVFNDTGKNSVHECNYPSIRVEDIAADIEPSMEHHDDFNYSPVTTPRPHGPATPNASVHFRTSPERPLPNNDPLNLQEELSFFDDPPVASSSMNVSVRHPLASPWRVEFGSLPIKWPVNTYVKPNMTPAVESSFISAEDSIKKKHVYTNLFLPANEPPEPVSTTPNLKQTSIISFIKEMAEKSAKKKRGRSKSPTKAIYVEVVDKNAPKNKNKKTTPSNKEALPAENTSEEQSNNSIETSSEKENSKEEKRTRKRKNDGNICNLPAKSPRKKNDKDCTYFGFDDSENLDAENVSPIKNNQNKGRSMRTRSRAVLQEINGPTRAALPVAAKTKIATSSDAVNKVYEELKSAADAPVFPEKDINVNDNATNIEEADFNDDCQSVHLFEDIEVVHHLKPTRKSYGKAKKVTFRHQSSSDSESNIGAAANQNDSSDYDDLADLTFDIPDVKEKKTMKKKRPKKLMSKKEEKEAEAWAANFNSMCEDIEDFPLLVE
ncbi:unnamed protein product [Chrysodeixis includens]|uniref:Uncharacterized protein n=1 Tax=Chrysodeixis includens TaxID=689277 RepID=A0A9P0BT44_CHRIL|nr:unnamed protein product [Chrysodeixis includens]